MYSISFLVIPPPMGLTANDVRSTSLMISWQVPDDLKGFITEYQVSYTMHDGSKQLHKVQDATSAELASLEPDTDYTIRVRAKSMVEFGEYSIPITIHTASGKMEKPIVIIDTAQNACHQLKWSEYLYPRQHEQTS